MVKSKRIILRQYIFGARNLYEKKRSSSEEEFPVGKIVIDFKKVEEACRNYKK